MHASAFDRRGMEWEPIHKTTAEIEMSNIRNYRWLRHDFTWAHARYGLAGLPDSGGLNIGYEAVDRHAAGDRRDSVALRCLGRQAEVSEMTYGELTDRPAALPPGCPPLAWAGATGSALCWAEERRTSM